MPSTICSSAKVARRLATLVRAAACTAVLASAVSAHDFWLEPSDYRLPAGELVQLRFLVGEQLEGADMPRREERIVRFVDRGPSATTDVLGRDGHSPAGLLRPREAGWHVIGYESTASWIELDASRFEAYLREEGLEHVIATRTAAGEAHAAGRERYARCAKTLLAVGEPPVQGADLPLGLTFELVAEGDALESPASNEGCFRALFRGVPLEGVLVVALWQEATQGLATSSARSDAEGRVTLSLPQEGKLLVKAVHMAPVTDDDPDADWESFWASLTFQRGRAVPASVRWQEQEAH